MKKLDLNVPILDANGDVAIENTTIAQALGNIMINSTSTSENDILKMFTWALQLGENGCIDIDEADSKTIKDFIVNNKEVFVIIKAPVLKAIDDLKFK